MSTISLRAYTREIDTIINQGRMDEAIAHCRHILSKFPKHIETYRLLGKAYLESNLNSNAADIFQRVLSSVPDDFVSHIGMSLIREEEGNLHSAVRHMERAFERQPYNNAIQEEIRRLYGKRDGIEPPKVRLTQGALARMYIKGGLIQQGIAELRSALSEHPDRFDLRTLLSEAYVEANQMGKAIDTASVILKKFPFNLTANRILANSLKSHDHPEEMAICRKRLYALSPYEAYVGDHAPTVDQVPDQAITLEKLDWAEIQHEYDPSQIGTEVDWSSALSAEPEKEEVREEPVPDWLAGVTDEGVEEERDREPSPEPQPEPTREEKQAAADAFEEFGEPDEEEVPEWLAGIPESGEPAEESEGEIPPEPEPEEFPDMEPDTPEETQDIPTPREADAPQPEEEEEIPEWMMEAGWEPSEGDIDEPGELYPDEPSEDEDLEPADIPDWLQGTPPQEIEETLQEQDDLPEDTIPSDVVGEEIEGAEAERPSPPPQEMEDEIDRTLETEEREPEGAIEGPPDRDEVDLSSPELEEGFPDDEAGDFPDWLRDIKSDEEKQDTTVAWLNNLSPEESIEKEDVPEFEGEDDLEPEPPQEPTGEMEEPDWLREMSEGASEAGPDWLREMAGESDREGAETPSPAAEDEAPPVISEPEREETSAEDMWEEGPQPYDEDPISEFEKGEGLVTDELEDEGEEFPDWLAELDKEEEEQKAAEAMEAEEQDQPEPEWFAPEDEVEPEEEIFKEFAAAEETPQPPTEEDEDLPGWLDELEREDEGPPQVEAEGVEGEVPEDQERIPGSQDVEEPAAAVEGEDELGWLSELEEQEAEPAAFPQGEEGAVEGDEMEEPTPEPEAPGAEIPEDRPAPPDLSDDDETMAWLESLAEKQGADTEEFVSSVEEREQARSFEGEDERQDISVEEQKPEDISRADVPDWLAELEPDEGEPPSEIEEPTPEEAQPSGEVDEVEEGEIGKDQQGIPDWLDEISPSEEVFTEEPSFEEEEGELDQPYPEEDQPATDQVVEEEAAEEGEIPDWLGELDTSAEPEMEDLEPEEGEVDDSPPIEDEESVGAFTSDVAVDDTGDLAWLDSLVSDEEDQPPEEGAAPAAEEPPQAETEEDELSDWFLALEGEEEDTRAREEPDLDVEAEAETEASKTDWLSEFEEAEEEAQDFIGTEADIEEDIPTPDTGVEEGEVTDRPPSEGMLKRLGELEGEEEEEEATDEIPEWLAGFKEEEDPQETAVLWLRRFIEQGEEADLEEEIKRYTEDLRADEVPEWIEDLQKEEDPTSTAMLWLERLEKDEAFLSEEEKPAEKTTSESDWLAELEGEKELKEPEEPVSDAEDFDIDEEGWLADLEQEDRQVEKDAAAEQPALTEDEEEEEETPPWMLATSPLEGDLLTGELMGAEEEEIPDWLAGYEDEEPSEAEGEAEVDEEDEYAWLSAYGEKGVTPPEEKLDLNTAAISQLESLIGISYQIAEGIVTYREKHGPFRNYDQVRDVPEIKNDQIIEILRNEVKITPPQAPTEEVEEPKPPVQKPQPEDQAMGLLEKSRESLVAGEIEDALDGYEQLIDDKEHIEQVIEDLTEASYDHPMDVSIIKTLGDAYMRIDKLQEALDAYSKAEDLLR